MLYALILAGGGGTRLWPHSRRRRPKQFLSLDGRQSLLQATVERIAPLVPPERVLIATGAAYVDQVREHVPQIPVANLLVEPLGRGTAPPIGLAALELQRRDPDAVMAVLSADHLIHNAELFRATLGFGAELARQDRLVTIGITPTTPSTGYGYIRQGAPVAALHDLQAYAIAAFVEKPTAERARAYLEQGGYVWNAGIFVWRARVILEEIARHAPDVASGLARIEAERDPATRDATLAAVFETLPTLAIDVAVMERTSRGVVIPVDLGWSDVGDWATLADVMPRDADGNAVVGQHLGLDTHNSLIYANGRLIATIGVRDLVVIDTPDALLICPRERAQEVRALVARLTAGPYEHVA